MQDIIASAARDALCAAVQCDNPQLLSMLVSGLPAGTLQQLQPDDVFSVMQALLHSPQPLPPALLKLPAVHGLSAQDINSLFMVASDRVAVQPSECQHAAEGVDGALAQS